MFNKNEEILAKMQIFLLFFDIKVNIIDRMFSTFLIKATFAAKIRDTVKIK